MASDTIDRVREAELNAEKSEKSSDAEAGRIVEQAGTDAVRLKTELTKESRGKSETLVSESRRRGDAMMADATLEAGKAVENLRSEISPKEEAAIKLILDDLTV